MHMCMCMCMCMYPYESSLPNIHPPWGKNDHSVNNMRMHMHM